MIDPATTPEALYLDLLKKCLTRYIFGDAYVAVEPSTRFRRALYEGVRKVLAARKLALARPVPFDPKVRAEGHDTPGNAETMIGLRRLDNLEYCITDVLRRNVPGDLIETGAWRGGATIFMRAVLKAYAVTDRLVWVADSFAGLPKPDADRYPADRDNRHWTYKGLVASLDDVKENFARYGLLDDQVRFLVGWFRDTLPTAPIERLAVLRLDGDMYESTMDALGALYPKVSAGGYVIVDDYGAFHNCRTAVDDFRRQHGISEKIEPIDWTGVFWRRLH